MRKFLLLLCVIAPVSLLGFFDEVEGNNPDGDVQAWFTQFYNQKLNDKCAYYLSAQQRFADGVTKMNLIYIEAFFVRNFGDWLSLRPGYRSQWVLTNEADMIAAYIFLFDGIYHKKFGSWEFSNRNRAQLNTFEKGKSLWVYRNMPMLVSPWRIGTMGFRPFIADEFFILQGDGFFENRLIVGGRLEFTKNSDGALSYINRYIKLNDQWRLNQILSLTLSANF